MGKFPDEFPNEFKEIMVECSHPEIHRYQRFFECADEISWLEPIDNGLISSNKPISEEISNFFPIRAEKIETLIFTYGNKYLEELYSNDLEDMWLCRGDIHISDIEFDGKSMTCKASFYSINIPYPSAAVMRMWKKRTYLMEGKRLLNQRLNNGQAFGRQVLVWNFTKEERKALMTLRDLVSERQYRRYLTNGFIMVKGQSDLYYQIFSDQRQIVVWKNNYKFCKICIHTDRKCPPTDHVINCKMMIEFDEKEVWKGGNVSGEIKMDYSQQLVDDNWHLITEFREAHA